MEISEGTICDTTTNEFDILREAISMNIADINELTVSEATLIEAIEILTIKNNKLELIVKVRSIALSLLLIGLSVVNLIVIIIKC